MKGAIAAGGVLAAVLVLFLSTIIGVATNPAYQGSDCTDGSVVAGASDGNGQIPAAYKADIASAAKVSGMSESLLAAQIQAESGWNPKAVSGAGARGLAQFMPGTWPTYSHGADPFDGHASIRAQGEYMRDLIAMMKRSGVQGNLEDLALTAYNWGPGNVINHGGIPSELVNPEAGAYAAKIRRIQKTYTSAGPVAASASGSPLTNASASSSPSTSGTSEATSSGSPSSAAGCEQGGSFAGTETVSFAPSGNDNYYAKTATHCMEDAAGNYVSCDGAISALGMYNRECVDFALFRVNEQLTGRVKPPFAITNSNFRPDGVPMGNATQWADAWRARGWAADHKPRVGDVAYYAAGHPNAPGPFGHVAVVKAVYGDGTYLEEGYNFGHPPTDHMYYQIKHADSVPSLFLHLPRKANS